MAITPEEQLSGLLRSVWRALVRATRSAERLPALPEAQAVLLQRLIAAGPVSPAQLAGDLHLARPTVSNLVRDLTAAGLVDREPSATDGRSVLLVPTPLARDVVEAFGRGRVEVLGKAMGELTPCEQARLLAALPALSRLGQILEGRPAPSEPRAEGEPHE
ncbi:MarR family transcriptional regulator [Actinoplanes sp. NPDC051633]|uniref:MarR family winged helix-turn-helix transcriptional regulator n=1 Tax=Actinoplanes sp. NPDC051633 TaxID=3155670 RepID=UPI003417EF4E